MPVDEIKKKRMREKANALWAEMNGPAKKRVKVEEKAAVPAPETPKSTSGSRFSFASPVDLIQQAQKAKEMVESNGESSGTLNTTVYEFAGEKVTCVVLSP